MGFLYLWTSAQHAEKAELFVEGPSDDVDVDDMLIEIHDLFRYIWGKRMNFTKSSHSLRYPKDSKDAAERAVQRFDGAWVDNRQIKLEVEA